MCMDGACEAMLERLLGGQCLEKHDINESIYKVINPVAQPSHYSYAQFDSLGEVYFPFNNLSFFSFPTFFLIGSGLDER